MAARFGAYLAVRPSMDPKYWDGATVPRNLSQRTPPARLLPLA